MRKSVLHEGDEGVVLIVREPKQKVGQKAAKPFGSGVVKRSPVHVVYGGAHLYKRDTASKLGRIALASLETYAPDEKAFAAIFDLDRKTAAMIYQRTRSKLTTEPVEDLRIDFEDGYGFRPDAEEDADAERCAKHLAATFLDGSMTAFSGFRIRSYAPETRERARKTLNIFLDELLDATNRKLPKNFVVTLPKVTDKKEVSALCRDLKKIEKMNRLKEGAVKIELMIEHPLAVIDRKGNSALRPIVEAAKDRCVAAHFGAYDYTAALGIVAAHQDIAHPACDLARQQMLLNLQPLGVRLSDSVTTRLPVPLHKGNKLSRKQNVENAEAVRDGWRVHFGNVRRSMANGFYQSWDLHPNQLVARYAAVYSFFLENLDAEAGRLRSFLEKATQATLTGHIFDDAATAWGIVNFLRQGLDCGAITEEEMNKAAGITAAQLRSNSFIEIVDHLRR